MRICSVPSCGKIHEAKGYCKRHYKSMRVHGDPLHVDKARIQAPKQCKIEGCEKAHEARGYCANHYASLKRHGDPLAATQRGPYKSSKICFVDGCHTTSYSNGLCRFHYDLIKNSGTVSPRIHYGCTVTNCKNKHKAKGYCTKHYNLYKKFHQQLCSPQKPRCGIKGCGGIHLARGLCRKHYYQWQQAIVLLNQVVETVHDPTIQGKLEQFISNPVVAQYFEITSLFNK